MIFLFSFPFFLKQTVAAEIRKADYFLTISALQQAHNVKTTVSNIYLELAKKALEERDFNAACLFSALSNSGSVHARNFQYILNNLGVRMKTFPKPDIELRDTKKNLEFFLALELFEIDAYYPKLIERIKPEGNESALKEITYAWKVETQHRDLIKKMKPPHWPPIGKVIDNLKKAHEYHLCQRCGSIVYKLPEKSCIICGSPVSMYKRTKSQTLFEFVGDDINKADDSNDFIVECQNGEPCRPKPVPRMHEWHITLFALNPSIFAQKALFAYEPTGLEGNMLTHYIEQELKLRINPDIQIKVGNGLSELKNKQSETYGDSFIFCISGEIQDLIITSKKSETWGVLKVKYIFAEQRINSLYKSREIKQVQIIPGDNSTDKTSKAILVHKNLTQDDMEKLLQNTAKEIVDRIVLKLPSVQERTK